MGESPAHGPVIDASRSGAFDLTTCRPGCSTQSMLIYHIIPFIIGTTPNLSGELLFGATLGPEVLIINLPDKRDGGSPGVGLSLGSEVVLHFGNGCQPTYMSRTSDLETFSGSVVCKGSDVVGSFVARYMGR